MRKQKIIEILMNSQHLLLVILFFVPIVLGTQTVYAQEPDMSYESIVTLIETEPICIGEPMGDLNCTLEYEIKGIISSHQTGKIDLLKEGYLGYYTNNPVSDMWISDNLGNEFTPIINETSIITPSIRNIIIESSSEYELTLHFKVTEKLQFTKSSYWWAYNLGQVSRPTTVSFKLSKDYQLFEYSIGGIESTDNTHTTVQWDLTDGKIGGLVLSFMPLSIDRIVKSIEITGDIARYDDATSITEKMKIVYLLSDEARIGDSILNIPIKIPFPINAKIESVVDGIEQCEPLEEFPVFSTDDSQVGRYYVDTAQQLVWVSPHRSFEDKLQFEVELTYIVPNIIVKEDVGIQFWEPYRAYAGLRFDFPESNYWKIDLTGHFEITLILPPADLEIVNYIPKENALPNVEGNREKLEYSYNSPISIPEHKWLVIYDNNELRTFSNQQITTIFLCAIPLAVLGIAYKFVSSTWILAILETILGIIFPSKLILDIYRFVELKPSHNFFNICFVIEIALLCLIIGLSVVILFVKKQNNVENNGKQPQAVSRYQENPFAD